MSHWTEKLNDFCKFDSVTDQNVTNHIVACWVYITQQITSLRIQYSEFILLALTLTQFTIS
jgi:hypothetical protein